MRDTLTLGEHSLAWWKVFVDKVSGRGASESGVTGPRRRSTERFPYWTKVKVLPESWSVFVDCVTAEVGAGGLYICSDRPVAVGERAAEDADQIALSEVVWFAGAFGPALVRRLLLAGVGLADREAEGAQPGDRVTDGVDVLGLRAHNISDSNSRFFVQQWGEGGRGEDSLHARRGYFGPPA